MFLTNRERSQGFSRITLTDVSVRSPVPTLNSSPRDFMVSDPLFTLSRASCLLAQYQVQLLVSSAAMPAPWVHPGQESRRWPIAGPQQAAVRALLPMTP